MRQYAIVKSFKFLLWTNSIQQNPDFGQIVTFKDSLTLDIFHKMFFDCWNELFYWIKVVFRRNGRTFVKKDLLQLLQNLPLLQWTQGQILESHVGLATRSTASVSLWKPLWIFQLRTAHRATILKIDATSGFPNHWGP